MGRSLGGHLHKPTKQKNKMGVLDEVTQLKKAQIPDDEIIGRLQEKGHTPKAIDDALNQSQVKEAVSKEEKNSQQGQGELKGMQQSIMERGETDLDYPPPQAKGKYNPKTQEMPQEEYSPQLQEPYPGYEQEQQYADPNQQAYYPQEANQQGYANSSGLDVNSMIEIAEQIISKENRKIENQIEDLTDFKNIAQTQINQITERVKRIELSMDKLQAAILEKIGSYGSNLESIKKEMSMIESSFSKVLTHKKHHTISKKTSKKKSTRKR